MKLYSVHDAKGNFYDVPRVFRNAGEAARAFETTCKQSDTAWNKYPADFTIVELGDWDADSGTIMPYDKHLHIARASDFIQ